MNDNTFKVDKNSFPFLFQEDIYIVPEKNKLSERTLNQEGIKEPESVTVQELEPVADAKPLVEKKDDPGKKTPSIPKIPVAKAMKDYAVVINNSQELQQGKEFLSKILSAVKIDLEKVDIFSPENAASLFTAPQHKFIFVFGLEPSVYGETLNKVGKKGQATFLFSFPLSELQQDVEKKKLLWSALQQIFK